CALPIYLHRRTHCLVATTRRRVRSMGFRVLFFFSSRRRHTRSVSAFLLNRSSDLAGGAMSKLFGGGQKAASGGIQGDVLATDNNTVGMGDAGIKSAIQGSNVPNPDEADLIPASPMPTVLLSVASTSP